MLSKSRSGLSCCGRCVESSHVAFDSGMMRFGRQVQLRQGVTSQGF